MKKLKYEELMSILVNTDSSENIKDLLNRQFSEATTNKAVLGIDIYRYSSMKEKLRNFVPFVAQILRDTAIQKCLAGEKTIFKGIDISYFEENFINTGDGGYFIFDTPIHAITFAIYFEIVVRLFNSYKLYPELRDLLKNRATLRYAMTYDKVYKYEKSSYGSGIITNARILSKDKLDRFLIDENVFEWFMKNIGGIENLQIIDDGIFFNIKELQNIYKEEKNKHSFISVLAPETYETPSNGSIRKLDMLGVSTVDIQKIGEIKIKNDDISIYNLHLQCSAIVSNGDERDRVVISLGNLNVSGISD